MTMEKRKRYIGGEPILLDGYWHVARIIDGENDPDITPYGFKEKYMAEDYILNVIINQNFPAKKWEN